MMTHCKEKENLAECILRKMIITVMVLALLIPIISPKVFAASSVTISGGDNIKGGDTFTVAVTFGGGDIGRVDGSLSYDTEKLTYISGGSSTGNSGYIQLKDASTDGSVTFNIEFQALDEGDTVLQVATREMYDLNEVYMSETPSASKTISISGSAASQQIITQTSSPDQPVAETELKGVDEKPDEGISGKTLFMVIIIAVPIVLIIIIAIILSKKKKSKDDISGKKENQDDECHENIDYHRENRHIDGEVSENIVRKEKSEQKKAVKKKASEETENWADWNGFDDNDL